MFFKMESPRLPDGPIDKNQLAKAEDIGSISDPGRSYMLRSNQARKAANSLTCALEPGGCDYWAHDPRAHALETGKLPQWETRRTATRE